MTIEILSKSYVHLAKSPYKAIVKPQIDPNDILLSGNSLP
jgi:hypothetical protein